MSDTAFSDRDRLWARMTSGAGATWDVIVIGSGIAGLTAALKLADHGSVTVIAKREALESNTRYAQGGIASVFHPDDSFEQHQQDTQDAERDGKVHDGRVT